MTPQESLESRGRVIIGDALKQLRKMSSESVHCVVTSPPYWQLRDYGVPGQLGLEATPQLFVRKLVKIMREARRVLRADGTCWLNMGDSYMGGMTGGAGASGITTKRNHDAVKSARIAIVGAGGRRHRKAPGLKDKDLCLIPHRLAIALQEDGWWVRSDVIWHKPSAMPESASDRPSRDHEHVLLLTKSASYFYDGDAIRRPLAPKTLTTFGTHRLPAATDALGKVAAYNIARDVPERKPRLNADGTHAGSNARTVWTIAQRPTKNVHLATFPPKLVEPCVLAGCPRGGIVLDPFAGSGTTLAVALELGRQAIGIELNPDYATMIERRLSRVQYPLPEVV